MTSAFLFINAELLFIDDVITKLNEIVYTYKVQGIYDESKLKIFSNKSAH